MTNATPARSTAATERRRTLRARLPQIRSAGFGLLLLASPWLSPTTSTASEGAQHSTSLEKLQRLEGSWTTERVEFLDADGNVRRTSAASSRNEFRLDRNVFVHTGRLAEPPIRTRGWYFPDPAGDGLRMGSVSTSGRYDEFVGGWRNGRLVMVSDSKTSASRRRFRLIHAEITDDAYTESLEVSDDDGRTWRMLNRQRMQRVRPRAVLERIDDYTGRWRSDVKTAADGTRFHFDYELEWMDASRTIAGMHITRATDGGERSTVFEGYKGLDPDGTVYYHAASPSGRGARGRVRQEGDALVTVYDGWSADGDLVRIRDVFEPVDSGTFRSRTYLRLPGEREWRLVGDDAWSLQTRTD